MKKKILFPIIALLLLTLISCEKDQFEPFTNLNGEEEMATRANATVPFKADFINTINPEYTFFDEDGNLNEEINGLGKGTHLGKCTFYSLTKVYTGSAPTTPPDPPTPEGFFHQVGTMTFTSADGSTLEGHYWGPTTPCSIEEGCFFAGGGDWLITSGTERFVGTTGIGTYSYIAIMDVNGNVTSELEFTGTLTNP